MNYIVWQYIFIFFVVATVICISATIILSIKYRLFSLIRSDLILKKDERRFQNNNYSTQRRSDKSSQPGNDQSQIIKPLSDTGENKSCQPATDNTDLFSFSDDQTNDEITELLHQTLCSDDGTQIINNQSSTKTDDISSENTVIADRSSTGTVIINNKISINSSKNEAYDSFIMIMDIKITNGQTDEIKKFR